MKKLASGRLTVYIHPDEPSMGTAAAEAAVAAGLDARALGKQVAYWMMAAPSGFAFYEAFARRAGCDPAVAQLVGDARFYQFDDYPISRESERFPVTFRHLLETRLFTPLRQAAGRLGSVHPLELTEDEGKDAEVMRRYAETLLAELSAPDSVVIEVKGIGMDGHWGFHGGETPLEDPPQLMRVPMGSANIQQQMIDWPEYFPTVDAVPTYAVTANVGLFLKADRIIDVVPQAEKEYAILACYGNEAVQPAVPSSAAKGHPAAESHITEAAARALLEVRGDQGARGSVGPGCPARLSPGSLARLKGLWDTQEDVDTMLAVLEDLKLT